MYKIKFDMPNLAQGAEVEVSGLGRFKNGHTYTIDDEQAEAFRLYGQTFDTETRVVKLDDDTVVDEPYYVAKPGPTLLQAFQNTEGVTVETAKPRQPKPNDGPTGDES